MFIGNRLITFNLTLVKMKIKICVISDRNKFLKTELKSVFYIRLLISRITYYQMRKYFILAFLHSLIYALSLERVNKSPSFH